MKVSVVICTYTEEMYDHFQEAVESVLAQSYDPVEVVLVVDGNESLHERIVETFNDQEGVVINCNDENRGVSYSRTRGAELASGDIVAFIDDDAVADPDWIAELVTVYRQSDAVAVGGKMVPEWVAGRPWFLPSEFSWLVGVTHDDFADPGEEVRNTFESNLSFRRNVFLDLGGFDTSFGPTADSYSHSEGAEIGTRLQTAYGCGIVYTPDAVVAHKVFDYRTRLRWLVRTAVEQGRSKRRLDRKTTGSLDAEMGYLQQLLTEHVPRRVRSTFGSPSLENAGQLAMVFVLTAAVGCGYLYETVRHTLVRGRTSGTDR